MIENFTPQNYPLYLGHTPEPESLGDGHPFLEVDRVLGWTGNGDPMVENFGRVPFCVALAFAETVEEAAEKSQKLLVGLRDGYARMEWLVEHGFDFSDCVEKMYGDLWYHRTWKEWQELYDFLQEQKKSRTEPVNLDNPYFRDKHISDMTVTFRRSARRGLAAREVTV